MKRSTRSGGGDLRATALSENLRRPRGRCERMVFVIFSILAASSVE
jgi:hypothetical protein